MNVGRIAKIVLVFAVMAALGAYCGGQLNNKVFESVETKETKGKPINILVMGIDARNAKENSRSDTMIVTTIDPNTNKVAMVSIPRDTRIKNSAGKNDRINSINALEGPEAACKAAGELLDVKIDYYVLTNFGGFGDIVDALGGVHIDVETDMYHRDPVNPELAINISKGYQYLDGKQALAFVRYRGSPTADIGRTENQQKFIKALAQEMMQTKTILKLPQLVPELRENVRTNLPLQDMIHLANMAPKLDLDNIVAQTLPGYSFTDPITGASYWEADKKVGKILLASLLQGETFPVIGEAPASARSLKTNPVSTAVAQQQEEANPPEILSDDEEGIAGKRPDETDGDETGKTPPVDADTDKDAEDMESGEDKTPPKVEPEQPGDKTNPPPVVPEPEEPGPWSEEIRP